jgi:hypothetical protein
MAHQSFIATYEKGKKIVLPPGIDWPDGTVVTVTPIREGDILPTDIVDDDLSPNLAPNSNNHEL